MLRLTNLANKFQRRTLRVLYGQTQAYPYDVQLDSAFDRTAGALSGGTAISTAKAAILPGLVATKLAGEVVTPATTWSGSRRDFGLFANFVGGELTDIPTDFDRVGVWRGNGSVYEVLSPAWATASDISDADEDGTAAEEVYLNANSKAQLTSSGEGANIINNTARLVNYLSSKAIIVELLV